jgi:hypothetical protein
MVATREGDLMGRGFLTALKRYDATIVSIARHVQRGGGKLRDSRLSGQLRCDSPNALI